MKLNPDYEYNSEHLASSLKAIDRIQFGLGGACAAAALWEFFHGSLIGVLPLGFGVLIIYAMACLRGHELRQDAAYARIDRAKRHHAQLEGVDGLGRFPFQTTKEMKLSLNSPDEALVENWRCLLALGGILWLASSTGAHATVPVIDQNVLTQTIEQLNQSIKQSSLLKDIQRATNEIRGFQQQISQVLGVVSDPKNAVQLVSGSTGLGTGSLNGMLGSALSGNFAGLGGQGGMGGALGDTSGFASLLGTFQGVSSLQAGVGGLIAQMRGVENLPALLQTYGTGSISSVGGSLTAGQATVQAQELLGSITVPERAVISNRMLAQSSANTIASSAADAKTLNSTVQRSQDAKTVAQQLGVGNALTATGVGSQVQATSNLGFMAGDAATQEQIHAAAEKADAAAAVAQFKSSFGQ